MVYSARVIHLCTSTRYSVGKETPATPSAYVYTATQFPIKFFTPYRQKPLDTQPYICYTPYYTGGSIMCLFKVYTGYTRDVAEFLLVVAETGEIAEGISLNKLEKEGIPYIWLNAELVFDNLSIQNVSEELEGR
jgi:hypothetical protein